MQLDRTSIAIRQRSWSELGDLTFRVLREYAGPILGWGFAGALPFAILNAIVLYPLLQFEDLMFAYGYTVEESVLRLRATYLMVALVFLQSPLALQGITFYLGQAVFVEKPDGNEVVRQLKRRATSSFLALGILRMGLLGWIVFFFIPRDSVFEPFQEIVVLGIAMCGVAFLIRALRPFAPEILLLEQCPFRSSTPERPSFHKRSAWLHGPMSSDFFGLSLLTAFVGALGWYSLDMSERIAIGLVFGTWSSGWWTDWILTPLNLWLIAITQTVFRFLLYLDTRIRLEGWELELRLKAEAERLGEVSL